MKKSTKIMLSLSVLVLIFLFYIVFKGVNCYTEVTDSTELARFDKSGKRIELPKKYGQELYN